MIYYAVWITVIIGLIVFAYLFRRCWVTRNRYGD